MCRRLCFFALDTRKNGRITGTSFQDLMHELHPHPNTNIALTIEKILLRINDRDSGGAGYCTWAEFVQIDRKHGQLVFPVARIQANFRDCALGATYWLKKMQKFAKRRADGQWSFDYAMKVQPPLPNAGATSRDAHATRVLTRGCRRSAQCTE